MKLTSYRWLHANRWIRLLPIVICLIGVGLESMAHAQAISTTTVHGTVYLANGQAGTGTLMVSWPSFTTASGQLVAADSMTVAIASDGFVSVNLVPNLGSTPAGLYYTAVYYLSDGTTSTEYWVVPSTAQATLGQVQAQLMPAEQAIQAVSKAYVDQSIASLSGSLLAASGGTLSGPLYLSADPTQPLQAADKHYVDETFALAVPLAGGSMTGALNGPSITAKQLGGTYQVDQFSGADFGAKLQACLNALSGSNGGTCDARNFTGNLSMGSNLTISTANATVQLPCATISTANQIIVTAGTRNVSLRGCALRGTSAASGSQGGTIFLYSGTTAMMQVGDPTYAVDTMGFHLDNAAINTTASSSSTAQGVAAYRTQELNLENLYLLGNSNQTGITLDGTGNYTGGTFRDNALNGFQTAINAIGHQVANSAITDWLNASTFVRLHIDCPTSNGNPIEGTYGINLQQGDGNTFTGGDVEGCSTALHLGANAQNNTILGLRNENSINQVVADAGSSYNSWITGGTMFTGALTDNGTRNSFLDTFHRSFNSLNGDWYGSQKDATLTNHYRLGIGAGNERGLLNEIQTDYGYRWIDGYSDATAGEQFYQIQDLLNNVYRVSIGQYNNGQSSTNNQTVINAAGTGAVVLNGSNNAGTGGVVFGSGGANESTVATVSNAGDAHFNGTLQVGGASTFTGSTTVKNQNNAEIDATLWAGLTASQKESYTYKDWDGSSQWYMVKDVNNNWALNSAIGGLDSFKAYQSSNSGDTYINAANAAGVVRINYEQGSGSGFNIYGGGSSALYASFTGATAIRFPGLAANSGHSCLQIDNSGYITNTGSACETNSGSGTVNAGTSGQIAYYNGNGTAISGTTTVSVTAGGTGSSTSAGALSNLGAAALTGAVFTGKVSTSSTLSAENITSIGPRYDVTNAAFGAVGDGSTDDTTAIQMAFDTCQKGGGGIVEFPGPHTYVVSSTLNAHVGCKIEGTIASSTNSEQPPKIVWNGSAGGTAYAVTGFTSSSNSTPLYGASSYNALAGAYYHAQPYMVTFTGTNSLTAGQWVDIEGLSTTVGLGLNRTIAQVAAATTSTFTVVVPFAPTLGTFTDSGTATVVNVVLAFDPSYQYEAEVNNISIGNIASTTFDVGVYYGAAVDTGTRIYNTWVSGANEYSYYFSNGGINMEFDKAWRSDGAGIAGIYWRAGSTDNLSIANGTIDNNRVSNGYATSGGAIVLDAYGCGTCNVHLASKNIRIELNQTMQAGIGAFTFYDNPAQNLGNPQFYVNLDTVFTAPQAVSNFSAFSMIPTNDSALEISIENGGFPSRYGSSTSPRWVGMPAIARSDISGTSGKFSIFAYAPSYNSLKRRSSGYYAASYGSAMQLLGDVNIGQLWQNSVPASAFLFSDTDFAALPNGTTLYPGQIIAPPSYWSGANGNRYAIDVVYQTGTTGIPNSGNTTCTASATTNTFTCTSATDLSQGQIVSLGTTNTNKSIWYIDATNSSSVVVYLTSNVVDNTTATELTFFAPTYGPELQFPTKSSSAPATLTWSQGDIEENSGATANGIAAWVNTGAGTPGTWAGIPLGNSSGVLAPAQIGSGAPAAGKYVDGGTGAWTTLPSNSTTLAPAWLQYLGTGADGAYEATAASCTAAAPCNVYGDRYYTSFKVDSGAYIYDNMASNGGGLVIHATGACTINGTVLVNWTKNTLANGNRGFGGGASGGSGGGTATGSAGNYATEILGSALAASYPNGTAGAASGGNGGNGGTLVWPPYLQRAMVNTSAGMLDGLQLSGAPGMQGGNSGGTGGSAGGSAVFICGSLDGTGGVIDASGGPGNPPSANSTGAGSGGGGGVVILSSQAAVTTWPSVYVAGGPGGLVTVPEAVATSGTCTSQPKATLGVTSGALSGTCTVVQAGAGCGTGAGITWNILGGGGTAGTAVVNPTWSSGALASCTVTPGTSSGYTAATYTTSGTGGDGGVGWYTEFQGW
jgi:hypothetical protein